MVRVTYHKAAESVGWWCRREAHEFEWLLEVRTPDDTARHYTDWLVEFHDQTLSDEQREQLRTGAEVVSAGRGQAVYLSADLAGWHIPGGKNWIYVLSAGGRRGALGSRTARIGLTLSIGSRYSTRPLTEQNRGRTRRCARPLHLARSHTDRGVRGR